MTTLPGPVRAALGLVATALDTARSLPEKAPEFPMLAVTTALQYSLRGQQRYAELIVRGDELVGRIRGIPDEPPAWATFDDDDELTTDQPGDSAADSADPRPPAPQSTAAPTPATGPKAAANPKPRPTKAGPTKAGPTKAVPTKAGPTKATPGKRVAAKKATPAQTTKAPATNIPSRSSAFDLVADVDPEPVATEPAIGPAVTEDEPGTVS